MNSSEIKIGPVSRDLLNFFFYASFGLYSFIELKGKAFILKDVNERQWRFSLNPHGD